MIEQPPLDPARRCGIRKIDFAVLLKCLGSRLSSIRNNSLNQFQAIPVSFMFAIAAQSIGRRREHGNHHEHNQCDHRQGTKILGTSNTPARTPTTQRPPEKPVNQVKQAQQERNENTERNPIRGQHVVANFVSQHV